jgi:hypothetical protein
VFEPLEYFGPRLAVDLETLMNQNPAGPTRPRLVAVRTGRAPGPREDKRVESHKSAGGFNFFPEGRGSWWAEPKVGNLNAGTMGNPKQKWTRAVRAVALLEDVATPEAVAHLRARATGHPEAKPTKVAAESLARIGVPHN